MASPAVLTTGPSPNLGQLVAQRAAPARWFSCLADGELLLAQQKLISKVRDGAKVTKKYDVPTTPHRRAERHKEVSTPDRPS